MTHKIIALLLLSVFLAASCTSHTRYRPSSPTLSADNAANTCISECRRNTGGDEAYYACLDQCPGLVHERGHCDDSLQICEEDEAIHSGRLFATVVGTGAALLLVSVALAAGQAIDDIDFTCDGVAHC